MGLWTSFKSKLSNIGSGIKRGAKAVGGTISNVGSSIKRGAKQAGKWAWDNREGIGKVIGVGLDIANTFGVPGAGAANYIAKGVSKAFKGDAFGKGLKKGRKAMKQGVKLSEPKEEAPSQSNQGYSLNTKASGGTKEGRMFNSYLGSR